MSRCLPRNDPYYTGFNTTGIDMNKDVVEVANFEDFNNCTIPAELAGQATTTPDNTSWTQVVGIVARPDSVQPEAQPQPKYYISTDKDKCEAGLKVQIVWNIVP